MIEVRKRNGKLVEFDVSKIANAIDKAMSETKDGVDEVLSLRIAHEISFFLDMGIIDVETIQNAVEKRLMDERPDVAKQYILYREMRSKERGKGAKYKLLDDEFLSKYKHLASPMGELGSFVYYRTYSRWLEEFGRREYWWETVARAVDYNCSLDGNMKKEEAQELYDNVFHLRQFLSGRTLWTGGTSVSKKFPLSNFNCFRRDTEFLTNQGIRNFNDFEDGDVVNVLNGNGGWSESTVKNFGKDNLVKLIIRRYGTKYTEDIYTTKNHLWFVLQNDKAHYKQVETQDLKSGDVLRKKVRYDRRTHLNTCSIGIQHGIVYGDGTYDKRTGHCRVSLIGDKQELLVYFTTGTTCTEGKRDSTLVYGLPSHFKELPENPNPEYIKGFILGLLMTDGRIGASVRISLSNYNDVKQIQGMCEIIGLTTSKIKEEVRVNNNFGNYGNTYGFTIHKEALQRHNMLDGLLGNVEQRDWVVESVEETELYEDVWCVIEPKTNSFTLRGGVHTHNCAFQVIDEVECFHDLLYLLMIGAGVGVRIMKDDVAKLPRFRNNYELVHRYYIPTPKDEREEFTSLVISGSTAKIVVGDSKNGWSDAIKYYFKLLTETHYKQIKTIMFVYNNVRPKGERLKTFGGTASGHMALQNMIEKINRVMQSKTSINGEFKLLPIDCLDICNIIGEGVVVGGVRRTAEIALFDTDDEDCINAKANLYKEVGGQWEVDKSILHRQMSNNSIFYKKKPTREQLHWLMEKQRFSGEPGFVNEEAALKRRDNFKGVNPCAEILLDSRGTCNLTTVNVMAFVEDGVLNRDKLLQAQSLSARAGYRMTLVELELPKWNEVQQRDKLLGCSLTGWQDMVNATNMSLREQERLLVELRVVAIANGNNYADKLGQERPLLVTTLKPEGTLSQLPVVSSGIHYSHSPYYIRRIRVNASDPIAMVCKELEYPMSPEVGQTWENATTLVVEFPVKAPKGVTKYDVSAIQQLENYKLFMDSYIDHNCSITIHVRDEEWEEVEQWVWDNWDDVVAVSFLPLDDSFYELLPYEAITGVRYNEMKKNMRPFIPSLISKYELEEIEIELLEDECATGSCPIR